MQGDIGLGLDPYARPAGERTVRGVDDPAGTVDLDRMSISIIPISLNGQRRLERRAAAIAPNHMLIDVDACEHATLPWVR